MATATIGNALPLPTTGVDATQAGPDAPAPRAAPSSVPAPVGSDAEVIGHGFVLTPLPPMPAPPLPTLNFPDPPFRP